MGGLEPTRDIDDFSTTLSRLQAAMLADCETRREWPAKVAAAVYAGLEFVVANPESARELTTKGGVVPGEGVTDTISCLGAMLATAVPSDAYLPPSTEDALVAGALTVVAGYLRRDRLDHLLPAAPDLVLLMLLPYLSYDEALRWAEATAGESR